MAAAHLPRGRLLSKHIAAILIFSSPGAMAATSWTVNTCDDNVSLGDAAAHTGSLRFVAAYALDHDEITLPPLACSTISLQHGAIALPQDNITIHGPGMAELAISGHKYDRVFQHTGTGWLKINDLSVKDGYIRSNASTAGKGGCVSSYGSVTLDHVSLSGCRVYKANYNSLGGGAYTRGALWLLNTTLSGNAIRTSNDKKAFGGGAFANQDLVVINSTISGNAADNVPLGSGGGYGGGLYAFHNVSMYYSTVSNNIANFKGGGLAIRGGAANISNSTISSNHTSDIGGGISGPSGDMTITSSTVSGNFGSGITASDSLKILNSTVAFNVGRGIELVAYQPLALSLQSSLISNNSGNDLDRCCGGAQSPIALDGAGNIVQRSGIDLPPGVATTGVCPLLGPLRDNGGPTKTHALLSKSPGIDEGDAGAALYDQRGFWRVSGLSADIGAYEIDQADVVFNSGFDGCP